MNKSKKLIAFPDNLVQLVEMKANTYGFSFGEYVRFVLANDVKTITETVEILDEKTENDLAEAMSDVKLGNVTYVTKRNIAKHLSKVAS